MSQGTEEKPAKNPTLPVEGAAAPEKGLEGSLLSTGQGTPVLAGPGGAALAAVRVPIAIVAASLIAALAALA